jgi:hypothetical protein
MTEVLRDDDPLWDQHTGKDLHRLTEWGADDASLAEVFYAQLGANAQLILGLLMDRPGERLSVDFIAAQIPNRRPGEELGNYRRVVSGALSKIRMPAEAVNRRLPFYWWGGKNGAPSLYAMKPGIAAIFTSAAAVHL